MREKESASLVPGWRRREQRLLTSPATAAQDRPTAAYSARRLAFILAATIFAGETAVMILLANLPKQPLFQEALVDGILLLLLTFPALYGLMFRPMKRQMSERQEAARVLEQTKSQLEDRVRERTAELAEAIQEVSRSLQALEKIHRETLLLSELIELLQACRTSAEFEDMLRHFGPKLFPAESGAIYVYRASRNLLEMIVPWGNESTRVPMFTPEDCWALRRGRQHVFDHAESNPYCQHLKGFAGSGTTLCIPMMAQGEAMGVLVLHSVSLAGQPAGISEETRRIAPLAAEQIALALANLQLREKLGDQAIRDPLTGMFNRRYFEETADRELRRAGQQGSDAGVIMIDIDHFKRLNDMHGHDAGDIVLKKVGQVLQRGTRIEDIVCRYGGEEFMLLLPDAGLETVLSRAEQLREAVRELNVRYKGQMLGSLTISCGVAMFPDHGHQSSELTEAADHALYRAKHEGRDRVVVALGFGAAPDELALNPTFPSGYRSPH